MTVKTITITEDAYGILRNAKIGDESFSELINRIVPKTMKVKDIIGALGGGPKEADEFNTRIKEQRKEFNKSYERRMKDVHSGFKRDD